ncbi:S-layer family protein [Hydrogenispora ethanolica]|uniref:S-layer family protein n=1 Tax=Hydrogenispora ethanolica TaxID=1082276 RepID=A0A4R1RFL6_HYDET|nr:S-layer homology domain-containing protein [Hydrogenispora ethanolica]TCL64754.1 S-layer family protein [Hydrogenispora ethanolica]
MITKRKFYLMLLGMLTLTAIFSVEAQAATAAATATATPAAFSDIEGNWAQKEVKSLTDKGVINGYPDGTFKPDQTINRAEFAKLVAKLFNYQPAASVQFPDIKNSWASSYIKGVGSQKVMQAFADGNFKPENPVNRGQLAVFLTRVLHIVTPEEKYTDPWAASFTDLSEKDWEFRYVEVAAKLGLLPESYKNEFHAGQGVTRAEAAWTLNALNNLSVKKGKISTVDPTSGLVNIQRQQNGDPLLALVNPDTVVMRNNTSAAVDGLVPGDEITVISSASGDVKYLKAFGKVTKNDLLSRVSTITKGRLTPDQINSIVSGDWDSIKDSIKGGIYNQMIEMGLTAGEAESIIGQDWNYLDTLSKDRLSQALSAQFGISQDFGLALLERDMKKIQDYGKVELATAALSRLLGATPGTDTSSSY